MTINGPPRKWRQEVEKSNRAAITGGWGPTLRLTLLRVVPAIPVGGLLYCAARMVNLI